MPAERDDPEHIKHEGQRIQAFVERWRAIGEALEQQEEAAREQVRQDRAERIERLRAVRTGASGW